MVVSPTLDTPGPVGWVGVIDALLRSGINGRVSARDGYHKSTTRTRFFLPFKILRKKLKGLPSTPAALAVLCRKQPSLVFALILVWGAGVNQLVLVSDEE